MAESYDSKKSLGIYPEFQEGVVDDNNIQVLQSVFILRASIHGYSRLKSES